MVYLLTLEQIIYAGSGINKYKYYHHVYVFIRVNKRD